MTTRTTPAVVAVLIYSGCIVAEVVEVAGRLARAGSVLHWVSPDRDSVIDESGLVLTPTMSLSELADRELDAVIVPGGDPGSVLGNTTLRSIVRRTADVGLVAGICAGVLVLGDAGVLAGRKVTHNFRAPWSPPEIEQQVAHLLVDADADANRSVGVVADGGVITALPNAAAEFSLAICHQLGLYDELSAQRLTRHLQGEFVPEVFATPPPVVDPVPFTVRMAQSVDVPDLVALQKHLFDEDAGVHEPFTDLTWPVREGHADFTQLLASETSLVLIAFENDQAVGFLAGYLTPSSPTRQPVNYAVLRSLYVVADRRSSGVGSALTERFIEWAQANDAVEAHVSAYTANGGAQRFYERHGFASHSITRFRPL